MRYYIYQIQFNDFAGKTCLVSAPNSCDPLLFDDNLIETKAIVFEQAKAINNDQDVTVFTDSIIDIPQIEYAEITNLE
jgi:hypothetical protein